MAARRKSPAGFSSETVKEEETLEAVTSEENLEETPAIPEILPVVIESIAEPTVLPEIVPQPMPEPKPIPVLRETAQLPEPLTLMKKPVRHRNIPRLSRIKK